MESITDLNGDELVNILDLTIVANAFGSYPDDPKRNPDTDIDGNGEVNILDLAAVAQDFGKDFRQLEYEC